MTRPLRSDIQGRTRQLASKSTRIRLGVLCVQLLECSESHRLPTLGQDKMVSCVEVKETVVPISRNVARTSIVGVNGRAHHV